MKMLPSAPLPGLHGPTLPPPDVLAERLALSLLDYPQVEWVGRTDSTNSDLLRRCREDGGRLLRPWLLGAHVQEAGRGRAGRTWQNREGAVLMFSCAYDVFLPTARLPALSPLLGVATCEALRSLIDDDLRDDLTMKWPNDIWWRGAKLGGLLIETSRSGAMRHVADHHVVVAGLGLNLDDARALSRSLNRRVADWREIAAASPAAASCDAVGLVRTITHHWGQAIALACSQGFDHLPERYRALDALTGLRIQVVDGDRFLYGGIACGVDSSGCLQVRQPDGRMVAVTVGEVSVLPLRGPGMP